MDMNVDMNGLRGEAACGPVRVAAVNRLRPGVLRRQRPRRVSMATMAVALAAERLQRERFAVGVGELVSGDDFEGGAAGDTELGFVALAVEASGFGDVEGDAVDGALGLATQRGAGDRMLIERAWPSSTRASTHEVDGERVERRKSDRFVKCSFRPPPAAAAHRRGQGREAAKRTLDRGEHGGTMRRK